MILVPLLLLLQNAFTHPTAAVSAAPSGAAVAPSFPKRVSLLRI
jgi:hypothetical protein